MENVLWFYKKGCPYCRNAQKAYEELIEENPEFRQIIIKKVDEDIEVDFSNSYDYYYVPTLFVGDIKAYEAHPSESFNECKAKLHVIFDHIIKPD